MYSWLIKCCCLVFLLLRISGILDIKRHCGQMWFDYSEVLNSSSRWMADVHVIRSRPDFRPVIVQLWSLGWGICLDKLSELRPQGGRLSATWKSLKEKGTCVIIITQNAFITSWVSWSTQLSSTGKELFFAQRAFMKIHELLHNMKTSDI